MIDVEWNDNANAAVREFAYYIGESDKGERYLEHVAPKKTVADAVEWVSKEWEYDEYDAIAYNDTDGTFGYYNTMDIELNEKWHQVCTREQFEAYVKEQEGEKWTHVYTDDTGTDIRCVLLAEHDEWAWVKDAGTVDTIRKAWLKPIKPTITISDLLNDLKSYNADISGYIDNVISKYDII